MPDKYKIAWFIGDCEERLAALEVKIDGLCSLIADAAFISDGIKSIKLERLNVSVKGLNSAFKEYGKIEQQLKKLKGN